MASNVTANSIFSFINDAASSIIARSFLVVVGWQLVIRQKCTNICEQIMHLFDKLKFAPPSSGGIGDDRYTSLTSPY
jgi:hypothetical protein